MISHLVQTMIEQYNYPLLSEAGLDDFLSSRGEVVLFFTENTYKFLETDDVAMILPELVKAFGGRFSAAVVVPDEQRRLQKRYGFRQWPTLVFLRNGAYLGAISRVRDWQDYLQEISRILASEPSEPPRLTLPATGVACSA